MFFGTSFSWFSSESNGKGRLEIGNMKNLIESMLVQLLQVQVRWGSESGLSKVRSSSEHETWTWTWTWTWAILYFYWSSRYANVRPSVRFLDSKRLKINYDLKLLRVKASMIFLLFRIMKLWWVVGELVFKLELNAFIQGQKHIIWKQIWILMQSKHCLSCALWPLFIDVWSECQPLDLYKWMATSTIFCSLNKKM